MSPKVILVFCAQALLIQTVFSSCIRYPEPVVNCGCGGWNADLAGYGPGYGLGSAYGYGAGYGYDAINAGVASTGGAFAVSTSSPGAPVGLSVVSENIYEGNLAASGNLPFLGAVALEGVYPTVGAGAVSYGCGNGAVEITSERPEVIYSGPTYGPAVEIVEKVVPAVEVVTERVLPSYGFANAGYGLANAGYGLEVPVSASYGRVAPIARGCGGCGRYY